jgi:hypothetical protein
MLVVCTSLVIAMDVAKIGLEFVGWSGVAECRDGGRTLFISSKRRIILFNL